MKALILLFLGMNIFVCTAQKHSYDSIFGSKVNIFHSETFSFKYPKSWKTIDAEDENIIVVTIAPIDEVSKRYMAIDSINEDGTYNRSTFIKMGVNRDSIKKEHRKYIKKRYIREFSKNQFNVSIEKKNIGSLANFMVERKKKIENSSFVEGTIEQIAENHFVNELLIFDDFSGDIPITNQVHTMHYYYIDGLLYTLVFTNTPDKLNEYESAKELIFRTFQFKQ